MHDTIFVLLNFEALLEFLPPYEKIIYLESVKWNTEVDAWWEILKWRIETERSKMK